MLDIFFGLTVLALTPSFTFLIEIVFGVKRTKATEYPKTSKKCLIIIPAHNEEPVIELAINSLKNQLASGDRILVVADNCNDATAEKARIHQCEVIVRNDKARRGKGYALDFAIKHPSTSGAEIVIVMDADCVALPNAIALLKDACASLSRPVQASYLMIERNKNNAMGRITQFAVYLKNHVRPLGLTRIGGSSPITGSGFAIPYEQIRRLPISSGDIAEDMKLGIEILFAGKNVAFLPHAGILSDLPETTPSITTQHKRWEHGHIMLIGSQFPKLLKHAVQTHSWKVFISAMDLAIPPFTLLMLYNFLLLAISGLWFYATKDLRPIAVASITTILQIFSLLLVNQTLNPGKLCIADIRGCLAFIISKRAIYLSLLTGNISTWIKTDRNKM